MAAAEAHFAIAALMQSEYGIRGATRRVAGENENYRVTTEDGRRFVLKLADAALTDADIGLEHAAVTAAGTALDDIALPRLVATAAGGIVAAHGGLRGRLLQFVDGTPWSGAGVPEAARLSELGRCLARLDNALSTVDHPAAGRTHRWDLAAAGGLRAHVAMIDDPLHRRALETAFHRYAACAAPFLPDLPRSLIHGDLNDDNILVSGERIAGLLDFGDCLENPAICELAIALAYVLLDLPDPMTAGGVVVAAYHAVRPLGAAELEVLFPLICGRLAVSVAISAERRRIDPDRAAWFVTEARAWRALIRYAAIDPVDAARALAAGTGVAVFPGQGAPPERLVERRRRHFCGALSTAYDRPLKIVRGRGQYLYDGRGRPYLDLYNNVCHVGHCHPRVVAAGQRQMALLNTNTRYLYDGLADYAERICATLPAPLQYCFFVNSGSEANELALRLAMTATGRRDMLVVDGAYHGHTTTMIDISPYKFMGKGGSGRPAPWVHPVPTADGYRGPFKGQGRDAGVAYADALKRVIDGIGRPVAGFITESLLSCGGQVIPPEGYLEAAFGHVRAAGGVCIADEVQVGFGRVGTHFWAFQQQGVVPDIVVMGKPIGNGHPMSAVVTTADIADAFAESGMEFFTTFGGNPVSCAIGMAVLDVVAEEGLQAHALRVGGRLRDGLSALMARHECIGDVRGTGLFIGVELVGDRASLAPAAAEAAALVNALKTRGILAGTDGPFHNVVKIKGPMVLSADDADMVVRAVDDALSGIESRG